SQGQTDAFGRVARGRKAMPSVVIDKRFCGPPNSANGGDACGGVAGGGSGAARGAAAGGGPGAARPRRPLRGRAGGATSGGGVRLEVAGAPAVSFAEAEDASHRTPYVGDDHPFPTCFVCGPARADGDGLRIFVGPLATGPGRDAGTLAGSWVPSAGLAGDDGR